MHALCHRLILVILRVYRGAICAIAVGIVTFTLFTFGIVHAQSPETTEAGDNHEIKKRSIAHSTAGVGRRVILKQRRGLNAENLKTIHNKLGAKLRREFKALGGLQVVELPPSVSVSKALSRYKASGLVEYAEPDYIVHADNLPNDPSFLNGTLWGLDNGGQNGGLPDADIDAPEAWDTLFGAPGIVVAVIDTGVRYTHEDLAANMWINPGEIPGNGIDDDGNGFVDDVYGMNAITNSGDPMDDNGHGTHVSGTIGAVGNNGVGVVGVAWQVQIMACKFLSANGSGTTSDAIECIDYARLMGAKVLNNSWGGGGFSQALMDAITAARDAGIVFVASAGNSAANNDATPYYPASYDVDNVVAVAATDRTDALASFSSFGAGSVELGAPGVQIYSSHFSSDSGYASLSGTSMAAPHVAGAVALAMARFPGASYVDAIRRVIAGTDATASLASTTISGGRLNLYKALVQDPLPFFTATPASGLTPLNVTFTDGSVGNVTSRSWDFGDGSTPSTAPSPVHTYSTNGIFDAIITISGPNGTFSRSRKISVFVPASYQIQLPAYEWIDPSGMTSLSLGDDSVSVGQALPFAFKYFGEWYTVAYIGANGLMGFDPSGLNKYANADLPNPGAPDGMICPYWDDLNPSAGGSVRMGTVGTAPNRVVVISWAGVPHYAEPGGASNGLSFQVLLHEGSNDITFQYADVRPATATGSGATATIGLENQTGQLAVRYSFDGSTPVSNGQAIRFTTGESGPPPNPVDPGVLAVAPGTGFGSSGQWTGPFSPNSQSYTLSNTGSNALSWTASKTASWVSLSQGSGALAPGASTVVAVSINANAESLNVGTYNDTITFLNATSGNGNTTRSVTLDVGSPPVINVNPPSKNYGSVPVGGSSDATFTVRNVGGGVLTGTAVASDPFSVVSGASYSIPSGGSATVVVRFLPTVAGTLNQSINFTGQSQATIPVTGTGIAASISVTPDSQDFGSVSIGSSANRTFTVSNTGITSVSGTASVSSPFRVVSGESYTLSAGASATVTLQFTPAAEGSFTQFVTFTGGAGAARGVTGVGTVMLNAPTGLDASASGSTVTLRWTDRSLGELGFKIERRDRPQGSWFWSAWNQVATVGANSTIYSEGGLQSGYHAYRVRAYGATSHSGYSNTDQVRTR